MSHTSIVLHSKLPPRVHADCAAEHAFALMLALIRRIGEAARNMTRAHWTPLPTTSVTVPGAAR